MAVELSSNNNDLLPFLSDHERLTTCPAASSPQESRRSSATSEDIWEDAKSFVSVSPTASVFPPQHRSAATAGLECPTTFTPKPLMLSRNGPESIRRQARTSRACSRVAVQGPPVASSPVTARWPSLSRTQLTSLDVDALLDACAPEEMLDYLQEYNAVSALPVKDTTENPLLRTPSPPSSSSRSLAVERGGDHDPERTPKPPHTASFQSADVLQNVVDAHQSSPSGSARRQQQLHQPPTEGLMLFPCPPLRLNKKAGPPPPLEQQPSWQAASRAQRSSPPSSSAQRPRRNTGAGAPPVPTRAAATTVFEVDDSKSATSPSSCHRPAYTRSTSLFERPSELPYRSNTPSSSSSAFNSKPSLASVAMSRSTASSRSSQSTSTTSSSADASESDVLRWSSSTTSAPSTAPTSPASSPRSLPDQCCPITGRSRSGSDFSMMSAFSASVRPPAALSSDSVYSYGPATASSSSSSSHHSAAARGDESYVWESSFTSPVWSTPDVFSPTCSEFSQELQLSQQQQQQQQESPSSSQGVQQQQKSRPNSSLTTSSTLTGSTADAATTAAAPTPEPRASPPPPSSSSASSLKSMKSKKSFKNLGKLFRRTPSQANLKAASHAQGPHSNETPLPSRSALDQHRPTNQQGLRML